LLTSDSKQKPLHDFISSALQEQFWSWNVLNISATTRGSSTFHFWAEMYTQTSAYLSAFRIYTVNKVDQVLVGEACPSLPIILPLTPSLSHLLFSPYTPARVSGGTAVNAISDVWAQHQMPIIFLQYVF